MLAYLAEESYVTVCRRELHKEWVLHCDIFQERSIDAVVTIPRLKTNPPAQRYTKHIHQCTTSTTARLDAHTCTNKLEFIWWLHNPSMFLELTGAYIFPDCAYITALTTSLITQTWLSYYLCICIPITFTSITCQHIQNGNGVKTRSFKTYCRCNLVDWITGRQGKRIVCFNLWWGLNAEV